MRYMLDTNICIYIAKRRPLPVLRRLERIRPGSLGMSVITYMELIYGAWRSERHRANLAIIEQLRLLIPVEPLSAKSAAAYGRLRSELESRGTPIGPFDLLIAAQALSLDLTLVTNNVREFQRVPGLQIENWAE
jgi:tRNA(fMet)-specific endonuclease VapC